MGISRDFYPGDSFYNNQLDIILLWWGLVGP